MSSTSIIGFMMTVTILLMMLFMTGSLMGATMTDGAGTEELSSEEQAELEAAMADTMDLVGKLIMAAVALLGTAFGGITTTNISKRVVREHGVGMEAAP